MDENGWLRNVHLDTDDRLQYHERIIKQVPAALAKIVIFQGYESAKLRLPTQKLGSGFYYAKARDFSKAEPAIVEMLYQVGDIGMLSTLDAGRVTNEIEAKLVEIAYRKRTGKDPLGQALLENSEAAQCLVTLQAKRAALSRFNQNIVL